MAMNVTKKGNLEEFKKEAKLYFFEPNQSGTICWMTLDDVPDKKKAKPFYFEELAKKQHFMAPVQKDGRDYAKIYIVEDSENVAILYVERHVVCQENRYYRK